jgi:threonine dehydrogenase-like Zn-dependent dehydrogenase
MAGICNTDLEITKGYMGFRGVLGHEFVGIVERAPDAGLVGRRVVGEINCACRNCEYCRAGLPTHCPNRTVLGIQGRDGAFADYLTLPIANLHPVPETITDEQAVFVEPLAAALEILEQVAIRPGQSVVVLGDGKLGLLVAQVLVFTACQMTLAGKHREKLALVAGKGIHTVLVEDLGKEKVDVVVECTGSPPGIGLAQALVKPRGTIVLKSTYAGRTELDLARLVIDEIDLRGSRCGPFAPALRALARRQVDVLPLISAVYDLDEGAAAMAHAERHDSVKILLKVSDA